MCSERDKCTQIYFRTISKLTWLGHPCRPYSDCACKQVFQWLQQVMCTRSKQQPTTNQDNIRYPPCSPKFCSIYDTTQTNSGLVSHGLKRSDSSSAWAAQLICTKQSFVSREPRCVRLALENNTLFLPRVAFMNHRQRLRCNWCCSVAQCTRNASKFKGVATQATR